MLSRLLVAAVLISGGTASAQSTVPTLPPSTVEDGHTTFKASVDLVTLNVAVTDGQDRHLPNLEARDFQVFEDGVPQQLTFYAASQVPLDVALLIDTSSSMREKLDLVRQAAERLVETLKPGDRAEVVGFNSQTKILQPFTEDRRAVQEALTRTVARGGTALYTALYVTLDQFMRSAHTSDVRRPAIVLLTDGMDTASLIQFDDVLERARRAGVAIYSISVLDPDEAKFLQAAGKRRFGTESDFGLKTLAQETGARAFFPLQLADLNGVYASVASELSTQYAIGYAPRAARDDGAFHRILVRVPSHPEARARTRTGYYSARLNALLAKPAGNDR
jgi:VWFA-related protein